MRSSFLKGTTISIVWCAFALKYGTDSAVLTWFLAHLLSLFGQAILISQGTQGRFWPAVLEQYNHRVGVLPLPHWAKALQWCCWRPLIPES